MLLIGIIMSITPRPHLDRNDGQGFPRGCDAGEVIQPQRQSHCQRSRLRVTQTVNFLARTRANCLFVCRVRSQSVVQSHFLTLIESSSQEALIILQLFGVRWPTGWSQVPVVFTPSEAGVWLHAENFCHCRTPKPMFQTFLCRDRCR